MHTQTPIGTPYPRRKVAWRQRLAWRQIACIGWLASVQLLVACDALSAPLAPIDSNLAGTVTAKLIRYAQRVVRQYDTNGDGRLDRQEWTAMRGDPASIDLNGDGQITVDEFARYAANYGAGRRIRLSTRRDSAAATNLPTQQPGVVNPQGMLETAEPVDVDRRRNLKFFAPLPAGTPAWFVERDADGDGQLTLAEFSPKLRSTDVAQFRAYDINGDGLLTAAELTRSAAKTRTDEASVSAPQSPARP
jgi:uncharacterized protein (DUF2141 family)